MKITKSQNVDRDETSWLLGTENIEESSSFTHLGLVWRKGKSSPDIQENIMKARRTAYSMIRLGLHGTNGIDPGAAFKILQTYVTPRLLHGLEAAVISNTEREALESFYRQLLRQIQSLPSNTAKEAVYLLLGAITIEAQLDRRILSLFGSISRLPVSHSLFQLAKRQLAVRYSNKHSWFTYVQNVGNKYDIDVYSALISPLPKSVWKMKIKIAINGKVTREMIHDAACKSSLKWWIWTSHLPRSPHNLWTVCKGRRHMIEAAATRARMITGRFRTAVLEKLYYNKPEDVCKLCLDEEEDLPHLLIRCKVLEDFRAPKLQKLISIYYEDEVTPPTGQHELCTAILNGWGYAKLNDIGVTAHTVAYQVVSLKSAIAIDAANKLCNNLCYSLAKQRDLCLNILLEGGSPI
jgi:hypothetical protein